MLSSLSKVSRKAGQLAKLAKCLSHSHYCSSISVTDHETVEPSPAPCTLNRDTPDAPTPIAAGRRGLGTLARGCAAARLRWPYVSHALVSLHGYGRGRPFPWQSVEASPAVRSPAPPPASRSAPLDDAQGRGR